MVQFSEIIRLLHPKIKLEEPTAFEHPQSFNQEENDFRLVFEIKFVKQLFDDYKPIKLMIWRTFTDTNLRAILAM